MADAPPPSTPQAPPAPPAPPRRDEDDDGTRVPRYRLNEKEAARAEEAAARQRAEARAAAAEKALAERDVLLAAKNSEIETLGVQVATGIDDPDLVQLARAKWERATKDLKPDARPQLAGWLKEHLADAEKGKALGGAFQGLIKPPAADPATTAAPPATTAAPRQPGRPRDAAPAVTAPPAAGKLTVDQVLALPKEQRRAQLVALGIKGQMLDRYLRQP